MSPADAAGGSRPAEDPVPGTEPALGDAAAQDAGDGPDAPAGGDPGWRGTALAAVTRSRVRGRRPALDRVTFLVSNVDGRSGVERTVLTLAAQLAETAQVEILTVRRRRRASFEVDPRVTVTELVERDPASRPPGHRRPGAVAPATPGRLGRVADALDRRPSAFDPVGWTMSARDDVALARRLRAMPPGVLVTTRPTLHAAVAGLAPPQLLTVAQEHLSFPIRMAKPGASRRLAEAVQRLDAVVSLTEADAADFRDRFPDAHARLCAIPNATSLPLAEHPPPLTSRRIVSLGRLERRKGMHRVVAAFAPLADRFPDWRLEIHGSGQEQESLRTQVERLGLADRVLLAGHTDDVVGVLDSSAVYAMGSLHEGFPMVLLEAFGRGLPVVSYDCPRGPADIIRDGVNGRLVPDGDQERFTAALADLMGSLEDRRRLGAQALDDVAQYSPAGIADRWRGLFAELLERRGAR